MNTYWKHALIRFFLWNGFITLIVHWLYECGLSAKGKGFAQVTRGLRKMLTWYSLLPYPASRPRVVLSSFLLFFLEQSNTFFSDTTWTPDREDNREDNYLLWDRSQFQFPERPSHSGRCSTAQHLGADPRAHHRLPLCVLNRLGQGRRWPRSSIWWWEKSESKSA